nr:unnamed protein product [Callosobruchus analis]
MELNRALVCLVKLAQMCSFFEERRNLIKNTGLNPKSRILNLSPFLDEHGVIRVGGRLKNPNYRFEKVHPILLCSKNALASLIVKFEHQISYHAGPQALLAAVRERYWILSGRRLCKYIINKCVVCRKQKAQILRKTANNNHLFPILKKTYSEKKKQSPKALTGSTPAMSQVELNHLKIPEGLIIY